MEGGSVYVQVDPTGSSSTKRGSEFFGMFSVIVLQENYIGPIQFELESLFRRRDFFVTEISVLCSHLSLGARSSVAGKRNTANYYRLPIPLPRLPVFCNAHMNF